MPRRRRPRRFRRRRMPGKRIVPCRLGGSYSPAERTSAIAFSIALRAGRSAVGDDTAASVRVKGVAGCRSRVVAKRWRARRDGFSAASIGHGLLVLVVEERVPFFAILRHDVVALAVFVMGDQGRGGGEVVPQTLVLTWKCETRLLVAAAGSVAQRSRSRLAVEVVGTRAGTGVDQAVLDVERESRTTRRRHRRTSTHPSARSKWSTGCGIVWKYSALGARWTSKACMSPGATQLVRI